MHCTMWSNSCGEKGAVVPGQQQHGAVGRQAGILGHGTPPTRLYLLASALHDLQGDGKDLVVHSHRPPSTSDLYQEDPEVGSPQIQGQELSFLCRGKNWVLCSSSMHRAGAGVEALRGKGAADPEPTRSLLLGGPRARGEWQSPRAASRPWTAL